MAGSSQDGIEEGMKPQQAEQSQGMRKHKDVPVS